MNVDIGTEAEQFLFWSVSNFRYCVFAVRKKIIEENKAPWPLRHSCMLSNPPSHPPPRTPTSLKQKDVHLIYLSLTLFPPCVAGVMAKIHLKAALRKLT